jgi:hypothetical protein
MLLMSFMSSARLSNKDLIFLSSSNNVSKSTRWLELLILREESCSERSATRRSRGIQVSIGPMKGESGRLPGVDIVFAV